MPNTFSDKLISSEIILQTWKTTTHKNDNSYFTVTTHLLWLIGSSSSGRWKSIWSKRNDTNNWDRIKKKEAHKMARGYWNDKSSAVKGVDVPNVALFSPAIVVCRNIRLLLRLFHLATADVSFGCYCRRLK